MKQLFAFIFAVVIATFGDAEQGSAVAQTNIEYSTSSQAGVVKYSNRQLRAKRRYIRGPRRVNTQIYFRHVPRADQKEHLSASPQERHLRYRRFSGYFEQRLPHLENGDGNYETWSYHYLHKYGYAQPYTPYFSHYFMPFSDGRFTGYFQN